MKIAILGFGREGQSVLKFLQKRESMQKNTRIRAKNEIWILDKNKKIKIPKGVKKQTGKNYLKNLERFDIIFRSPGIPYNLPELEKARKYGVKFSSPTKLFFELCPAKIIGVTGTKGKGTTSSLIYEILKAAGKKVFLAGNIGLPPLELLPKLDKNSWIVLELSSFQLIDLEKSPRIAVALMVTSEHLDWHRNTKEYIDAKANIVRFQSRNDSAVLARDYPKTMSYAKKTPAKVFTFSRRRAVPRGAYVKDVWFWFSSGKKKERVSPISALRIPGRHNWENVSAAIIVGKILGIPNKTIAKAISRFKGLEHRLELAKSVGGVKYYNDSYSTTPETAEAAIKAFDAPKILILGGSRKGSNFGKLGRVVSKSKSIKAIVGIGVEWPRIKREIRNKEIKIIEGCRNMKEIVRAASSIAAPGDAVLLSPACASFDMFKNYADRGRQFKKLVKRLKSR